MKIKRRILALLAALVLVLARAVPAAASGTSGCIQELIRYYSHYREDAQLDIQLLLAELAQYDGAQAAAWEQIMGYWSWVNEELDVRETELADTLPQDDSLCIVVLGYQLERDGDIRPELKGRLETALAAAEQYPNAYILCTGGPTAADDKDVSEASEMADWLARKGVSRSRLIEEDRSMSTLANARYSCDLLYDHYPQVRQLAVITSDYHLSRSCVYFNTQAQLESVEREVKPLTVTGAAAWQTTRSVGGDMDLQAEGVASLAGVSQPDKGTPKLSRLSYIQVAGENKWAVGTEPTLQVRAVYTSGRSRDVTYSSKFSGFDLGAVGKQEITVTYREGDRVCTTAFGVEMLPSAEYVPEDVVIETVVSATAAQEPEPTEGSDLELTTAKDSSWLWLALLPVLAVLLRRPWRKSVKQKA